MTNGISLSIMMGFILFFNVSVTAHEQRQTVHPAMEMFVLSYRVFSLNGGSPPPRYSSHSCLPVGSPVDFTLHPVPMSPEGFQSFLGKPLMSQSSLKYCCKDVVREQWEKVLLYRLQRLFFLSCLLEAIYFRAWEAKCHQRATCDLVRGTQKCGA